MKKINIGIVLLAISVIFVGCGSNGGSDSSTSSSSSSETSSSNSSNIYPSSHFQINVTGASRSVNVILDKDQNILAGYGCSIVRLYDENLNEYRGDVLIPKGNYKAIFTKEKGNRYPSVTGILYGEYLNQDLEEVILDKVYSFGVREANIYKLVITKPTKSFIISGDRIKIYNEDYSFNTYAEQTPFVLTQGTYYLLSSPSYCSDNVDYSFKLSEF
jgi:hypothetical protein